MPRYLYGMRHLRGFGPGCQPARGLISREDDPAGRYNDVLVYDRELEPHEIDSYELDFMGVEPDTTTDGSITVKKGGNDEDRTTYDYISRQKAIDVIRAERDKSTTPKEWHDGMNVAIFCLIHLPSIQPEQTETIKEIRKWINSGNRGSADYFIVDKIEEIINKYE